MSSSQENRSAPIIQFNDAHQELDPKSKEALRKRLKRTPSAASQAIIAYRTLSITVSENQAKGVKKSSKKSKKDFSEGKFFASWYSLSHASD